MTTSSVYTYSRTRDQIVTAALRKLGVLAEGQTPSAQDLSDGAESLNAAVAELRGKGMMLWARTEYTFTPTTGSYNIGTGLTLNTVFPVHLLQAIRTDTGAKIDMEIVSKTTYNTLPQNSTGTPLKLAYQPFINYGIISLWPAPTSTNTSTITLVYQRPFQYFISNSDTADFPEEWYNALIYKLAVLLAPEWSIPMTDRQQLKQEAKEYLEAALENGGEDASFFIMPHRRT